ncbi:MAG: nitroreductase family protein [Nanoarchaeota archaeon]|nr:nitroreductase family protein [Nanoarchaeota archaeon]
MQLDKAIQNRHSTRKFKDKKPDWRDIIECVDAMRHAPMAGNNFSLKFILVDDEKTIQKLADAAQQDFIKQAKYVVVVCTDSSRTINAYEKRGEIYCRQQAGAAIQNFLLKIEDKGLATCWIGHFVDRLVKEALKIPNDINVEAFFPVGYEFKLRTRQAKIDLDNVLYFHKFKNKKMNVPQKLDI